MKKLILISIFLLCVVMASSVYGQTYDFTDGLVAYYPMEDTSFPVLDNSGINHLEIRSGTPDLNVTGKVGQGIDFESSSSEALANYSQVVSGYPFTLAGWFKPESNGALTGLIDLSDLSSTNINYQITRLATNKPYVYARNGGSDSGCSGGTDMTSANGWRHVVGVFSSDTNRTLYVDGVKICSATGLRTFNSAVDVLTLGAYGDATPAAYFDGVMDEIAIWNKSLNNSEISQLTNCGSNNFTITSSNCTNIIPLTLNISVSYPIEGITFQRHNSTTGEIKVVGTYTGNVTSIEASFDGSAYTTIDSSPSGNTFTGYFNVSSLTQGDLIVRTNNASVNFTVNNISIGDLYVTGGQSNGDGRGTTLNNLNSTNPFFVFVYKLDDSLTLADDPTSSQGIAQGSAWVRLANNLTQTHNIPIGLITTTEGSTSIDDWNGANFNDMIQQIYEYTNGTMKVKTLLFDQGEEDVVGGELGNYATYKNKLKNMSDQFIFQTNVAETVLVRQLGAFTTASRNPLDNIRKAQRDLWIENNNISCGGLSYDIDLGDTVHFKTDSQMEVFSNRWIGAVNSAFYGVGSCRGAILTSATTQSNSTNITLYFDQDIEVSDYLGNLGVLAKSIWINDSGTIQNESNISSTSVDGNRLYIVLESPVSNNTELRIGSGNDGYNKNVVRSLVNGLPAEALKINITFSTNQAPQITLNSPSNNTYINTTNSTILNFTAYDNDNGVFKCYLYSNNSIIQTYNSYANNTIITYNYSNLNNGLYSWFVNCTDNINTTISETRLFTINVTYTTPTNTTGTNTTGTNTTIDGSFSITTPSFEVAQQDINLSIQFFLVDDNTGILVTSSNTVCKFYLYDKAGDLLDYQTSPSNHVVNINGILLNRLGEYSYVYQCNDINETVGSIYSSSFMVTPDGINEEVKNNSIPITVSVLMIGLSLFFILLFATQPQDTEEKSNPLRKFFFLLALLFINLSIYVGAFILGNSTAYYYLHTGVLALGVALSFILIFFIYYIGMSIWEDIQNESQRVSQNDDFK